MAPVDPDKLRHHLDYARTNEIAAEEVWKIVEDHLSDFDRFIGAIAGRYLAGQGVAFSR